ncbi:DUF664 domain-containing protein [Lentzea albida]|uniref:mycothiol transferase n=1 Tax=Lentzea albida TaxID=65499 RepID=UPI003183F9EA
MTATRQWPRSNAGGSPTTSRARPRALPAVPVDDVRKTLRWLLAHRNTETARQAGHADVLRERIDGTTGR